MKSKLKKKFVLSIISLLLLLSLMPASAMSKTNAQIVYSQENENTEMSEVQKVAAASAAVKGVLSSYKATNSTSKDELTSLMQSAINSAGITHVSVSWHGGNDFAKADATESTTGKVTGQVDLISGTRFVSITIDKDIDKLDPKPTPVPTIKPTTDPTSVPTVKPTTEPTPVPTVKPTPVPTTKPTPTIETSVNDKEVKGNVVEPSINSRKVMAGDNVDDNTISGTDDISLIKEYKLAKANRKLMIGKSDIISTFSEAIKFMLRFIINNN